VFATGMIIALFLLSAPITPVLASIGSESLAQLSGLFNPVSLLSGVYVWLFGGGGVDVGSHGPVYGLVFLAVAAAGIGLAILRFRKVRA
jgi:ABC-2 type transport system permease protein